MKKSSIRANDDDINGPRSLNELPIPHKLSRERVNILPDSSFTNPRLNTSKLIKEKLEDIQRRLEDDEISIATIETTASDRRYAAAEVRKVDNEARYRNLPSPEKKPTIQPIKKINRKVDPDWLFRKENCGLKPEDTAIFYPPQPLVDIVLTNKPEPKKGGAGRCTMDASTLSPSYSMTVNPSNILGSIDDILKCSKDVDMINKLHERAWLDTIRTSTKPL